MAIDREKTLRKAETLLRQGRLDAAIEEYVRVVEDQPRDWTAANALGDLYTRAGLVAKAVEQYSRVAEHFVREGFLPKAVGLYKKILKIAPDDEAMQLQLGEISARLGLYADAKTYFSVVAERRRTRGDRRGADEIVERLGNLDPADLEARIASARLLAARGERAAAAGRLKEAAADLLRRGREEDGLNVLGEAARLDPSDFATRAQVAQKYLAAGKADVARQYLDRETAGSDATLLRTFAEIELLGGRYQEAREALRDLLAIEPSLAPDVQELGWTLVDISADAAFACVDVLVEQAIAAKDWPGAAAALEQFAVRVPNYVPSLLRLIEVSVDGDLESTMYSAQALLVDAYVAAGQAAEARFIIEDLIASEPWETAHVDRYRRALTMLGEADPDAIIAERLEANNAAVADDELAELADVEVTRPEIADDTVSVPLPASPDRTPVRDVARAEAPAEIDLTSFLDELMPADTSVPVAAPVAEVPQPETPVAQEEPAKQGETSFLDRVFEGFRRQVSRRTATDIAEVQYKLGVTYGEMGLLHEATKALEIAAHSPQYRFQAASLLARLCRSNGRTTEAIEWFERAAETPPPTIDEGRALLYDLAETLAGVGETARSLAVFLELQTDAPDYRDVSTRIEDLFRVQSGG